MIKLLHKYPSFITFGLLQYVFTAPGQTFLIALFLPHLQTSLSLSATTLAAIYSTATLSASLLLNPAGRLIDRLPPHWNLMLSCSLFSLGCVLLATASSIQTLFIAFFLLRLLGQGVFALTSSTLISKTFQTNRGASLGLISLGYPLSELIYPTFTLWLLSLLSWQGVYYTFGLMTVGLMLPIQLFLIRQTNYRLGTLLPEERTPTDFCDLDTVSKKTHPNESPHATLGNALRDPSFYIVVIVSCLPPTIMTGLFFYQNLIFEAKGWAISLAATAMCAYAIMKAVGAVAIGPYLDRSGPLIPFILYPFLLGVGTFVASLGVHKIYGYIYFSLMGIALGISSPVMTVIWTRLYGTRHLGSIRGFVGTIRNGCTGFAPLPMAWALSMNYSIEYILFLQAIVTLFISLLPLTVNRLRMNS